MLLLVDGEVNNKNTANVVVVIVFTIGLGFPSAHSGICKDQKGPIRIPSCRETRHFTTAADSVQLRRVQKIHGLMTVVKVAHPIS
ncbi:Hypothetical protein NTJ_13238 [Nesidiocoris tenuis]|uniref:Secreted protein n=1 Tax=Nesidiocoris tenuis TaxID=355587 RepID=A0ABN7B7S1_9HEMI|nr:Hypothetical protein NTJ_13238 [Nesidiocoris tenuis]